MDISQRISMDEKLQSRVTADSLPGLGYEVEDASQSIKGGTVADTHDMSRMGKQQELRRNFGFWSIVGFIMVLQSTWESMLLAASYGLTNGGTGGVIWVTVGVIFGALCMIASIAEMASMFVSGHTGFAKESYIDLSGRAPTAGGQYHWVSEFAPRSIEKPLSYLVGWCCCLGWVTGNPASAQLTSTLVQGLVLLKNEDANVVALWQTALFIMIFIVVAVAFNIFLAKKLPLVEGIFLVLHVVGFFAFLITLWVMGDRAPAGQVFTQFSDGGGWGNMGLSCLVGITTPLWCFLGPDAGAHMAEELKDASRVLPSAMVWATLFNGLLGLAMLITLCFCLGNVDDVLNSPTGVPIIQVLHNSTGSMAGTAVLTVVLILLSLVGTITCFAASSRQVWAFARDKGFPFSGFIAFVRPGWDIPINALIVVLGVSLLITALNFGSDVALNAIISLSNAALIFSYIASIGCIRLKRWRRQPLLPRRWTLGPFGGPVNDAALVFLLVSFVMSFFPVVPLPSVQEMNWAVLIFGVVIIAATVNYYISAQHHYIAPVALVKRD